MNFLNVNEGIKKSTVCEQKIIKSCHHTVNFQFLTIWFKYYDELEGKKLDGCLKE